ncbi:MAG: Mur ligase middle domain protein [Haloplasmataceae bacterium]|nr:Mur ligase middle domain protein [Haloplasmataceae bacterium]
MKKIYVNDIVKAVDGKLLYWKNNASVTSVVNFNEKPINRCLYLICDFDDEDYLIEKMKKNQVSGVLVKPSYNINLKKWVKAEIGVIEVDSISGSYLNLAKFYRKLFDIPMIEVIGSSGKTTTKEIIGCVLGQKYNALVGYENFNAPTGVAYNLLSLEEDHQACVLEVGMKGFGIMDFSSGIVKPNIAVVTSIQRAHFTSLGSIENIIKAKSEILKHITSDGILLINGDDINCLNMPIHKFKGALYTFGINDGNDIYAKNIKYENGVTSFDAVYERYTNHFEINTFGKYNVSNALSAILIGYLLDISVRNIRKGLLNFTPNKGRQETIKGINNSMIINDNFNANPESTMMLLDELPQIVNNNPLLLVLGDLERPNINIEEYAKKIHYEIGKKLKDIDFTYLLLIGKWAYEFKKAAIDDGVNQDIVYYYKDVDDAKSIIKKLVEKNSVVVFKAQKAYVDFTDLIDLISV